MKMKLEGLRNNYEHTIYASYIGYITQAIVNNFAPLLFLTFVQVYGLTMGRVTLITTVNFGVQLLVDLLSAKLIDRIGYRIAIVAAHIFAALGLVGMALLPGLCGNVFGGLMSAVVLYAVGGGIIEVLVSPIVEACPTKKKEAAMSLLHSFYCWGHVSVVLLSTLFFRVAGIGNWKILAFLWAIVPVVNGLYFTIVPIYPVVEEHEKSSIGELLGQRIFWLLLVLMVCAGASEQAMSQWASAFAEAGLRVSKTVGDLAGPCAFAFCMGTARAVHGKYSERFPLNVCMIASTVLCILCYLIAVFAGHAVLGLIGCALCGFSVGIFWPGTFSIAAWKLPKGGTAMYAFMALGGDVGCSLGPTVTGFVAAAHGGNLKAGLMAAVIFPILILAGMGMLKKKSQ